MESSNKTDVVRSNSGKTSTIAVLSAGIDGINQAVRALYSYKANATYKDLAKGAGLHPVYMSQSLSASRDAGLTELAGKRGLYRLTSKGEEYARFLSYGETEKAKVVLKEILTTHPSWAEIIKFLKISYTQERSALSLVGDVEGKLGKHWTPSVRVTYASSYVSVLKYVGLIAASGENIISQVSPTDQTKKPSQNQLPLTSIPVEDTNSQSGHKYQVSSSNYQANDYSEFSIPEEFKVFVRKNIEALTFFESQVKENSIFIPWIMHEKNRIAMTNKKPLERSEAEKGQVG